MTDTHFDPRVIEGQDKMIRVDAELRKQFEKQNETTRKDLAEVKRQIPPDGEGLVPMPLPEPE